jgi:hypothetical protein
MRTGSTNVSVLACGARRAPVAEKRESIIQHFAVTIEGPYFGSQLYAWYDLAATIGLKLLLF